MSATNKTESLGQFVRLERSGPIAIVTYDRGDGLNALSASGMKELKAAASQLREDDTVHVVVLKGETVFSAGADLNDPALRARKEMSLLEQRSAARLGPDLCQAWADLEQITIAAIEGFCIGGGLALAAACDHRIASKSALFRLPEIPLGMNMSWRSIPRIAALIGPSRAKQLVILGKKVPAPQAQDWGLIDELTADGESMEAALQLAKEYASLPPIALRMSKQAIDASVQPLAYSTSFMDRDQFLLAQKSNDQREAVLAFLEKRAPEFKGN